VLIYALFDQEHPKSKLLKDPTLYHRGQANADFTYSKFFGWVVYAIAQAVLVFYVAFWTLDQSISSGYLMGDLKTAGKTSDYVLDGSLAFGVVVVLVTSKIIYDSNTHNIISVTMQLLSIASFPVIYFLWTFMRFSEAFGDWNIIWEFSQSAFLVFFFFFCCIPIDMAHYHWTTSAQEKQPRKAQKAERAILEANVDVIR